MKETEKGKGEGGERVAAGRTMGERTPKWHRGRGEPGSPAHWAAESRVGAGRSRSPGEGPLSKAGAGTGLSFARRPSCDFRCPIGPNCNENQARFRRDLHPDPQRREWEGSPKPKPAGRPGEEGGPRANFRRERVEGREEGQGGEAEVARMLKTQACLVPPPSRVHI